MTPSPRASRAFPQPTRLLPPPPLLSSDTQIEWVARLVAAFNACLDAYRAAKAWAFSQSALALALLFLAIAIVLRWLGWV